MQNSTQCAENSICTLHVIVDMTLLQCFRPSSMRTLHIKADNILRLALATQQYAKIQPKFDVLDK